MEMTKMLRRIVQAAYAEVLRALAVIFATLSVMAFAQSAHAQGYVLTGAEGGSYVTQNLDDTNNFLFGGPPLHRDLYLWKIGSTWEVGADPDQFETEFWMTLYDHTAKKRVEAQYELNDGDELDYEDPSGMFYTPDQGDIYTPPAAPNEPTQTYNSDQNPMPLSGDADFPGWWLTGNASGADNSLVVEPQAQGYTLAHFHAIVYSQSLNRELDVVGVTLNLDVYTP
jgi:hypothetical protein